MSRSLSIECEWLDEPGASDPVERRTWAMLRIVAGDRSVTRLLDRITESERQALFVPAFPIAHWLVANWWCLLHEPMRSEVLPAPTVFQHPAHRPWMLRHCLRASDSGLFLPRMFLYSNGPSVCVNWAADEEDAYPHMPGYFVESGLVCAERDVVDVALREFVSKVLSRLQGSNAPQVKDLRQNWSAISEGDAEESAFCMASAQMGLDPYSSDTWDAALVQFLEHQVGDALEEPLTRDFLEAATAPSAVAAWRWVADTTQSLGLQRRMPSRPRPPIGLTANAATIGYSLAQRTRGMAGLSARAPVADLSSLAERLGWGSFSFEERNHLPPSSVRAAVGWRSDTEPVVAGPQPGRSDSLRFLEARGLYHVLFGCEKGPRLVTEAHTWDQQASRAFAAELLVPRDAILDRCAPDTNSQELDNILATLAGEYQVSTKVIEHQLENSGISVSI